ncbi:MAG: hypothetical protein WBG43_06000 [Marinifilaceae bacterium]
MKNLKELLEDEEFVKSQDKLSVFKLKHTKNSGVKTYRYSFSGFSEAIIWSKEFYNTIYNRPNIFNRRCWGYFCLYVFNRSFIAKKVD